MSTIVTIKSNDGTIRDVEIENYDPEEITKQLNDSSSNYVNIGDVILQRYSVIRINPVDYEEDEEDAE